MFSDAKDVPDGSDLEADVCIIGAGPAGSTLAMELLGAGLRVLLLESGNFEDDATRDDLSAPASAFQYGTAQRLTNVQRFGGNANAWNIRTPESTACVRFAAYADADFEPRADLGDGEWPLRTADLSGAAQRACALWKIAPDGFTPQTSDDPGQSLLDLGPALTNAAYQFPEAATVTKRFRDAFGGSSDISVLLNAMVTELEFDGARAVRARVSSRPGHGFSVSAGRFVIAAGALNACKLLFNSRMADGITPGNRHDVLGRYLMDHPSINGGVLTPSDPSIFDRTARYDVRRGEPAQRMAHLRLSDERLREGGVLALACQLFPRDASYRWDSEISDREHAAAEAALAVRRRVEGGDLPRMADVATTIAASDILAGHILRRAITPWSSMRKGGWSQRAGASRRYSVFEVIQSVEQAPHRDNRILPSNETDAFGHQRITLDWRWHEADQQKTIAAQQAFEHAVARSGLGRIDHARPEGRIRVVSTSSHHHIGGLRMGRDRETSVTDANCRIHGTENLYVAGAGLFTTGSYANPTFLIAVLAVRLAGHLANRGAGAHS